MRVAYAGRRCGVVFRVLPQWCEIGMAYLILCLQRWTVIPHMLPGDVPFGVVRGAWCGGFQ